MPLHSPIHDVYQLTHPFRARVEEIFPRVLLCEFRHDGVSELLCRGLAAKVTGDSFALRNGLSVGNG
jgi:hypothetical protein